MSETALSAEDHVRDVFRILRSYEHSRMVDSVEAERAILARLDAARSEPATDLREAARAVRDNAVAGWQPMDNDFERFYRLLADLSTALTATEHSVSQLGSRDA